MRIVKVLASRLDLQKDGTYKYAYKDREIATGSQLAAKAKRKPAKRKPKAA